MKLIFLALSKLLFGFAAIVALIFIPAGDFSYTGGWIFTALLFIPMLICGIYLALKAPGLLEKRMRTKEKHHEQRLVVTISLAMFVCGFVFAGISYRFDFLMLPLWVAVLACIVFLCGYVLYFAVLLQNEYLSRVIEVCPGQKLVDSGLYSVVRHPMYLATVLMFVSVGFMLMSVVSAVVFLVYPVIIIYRIKHEESILAAELCGYEQYRERVKYKLIPKIY